jgi:hypothetical protein
LDISQIENIVSCEEGWQGPEEYFEKWQEKETQAEGELRNLYL